MSAHHQSWISPSHTFLKPETDNPTCSPQIRRFCPNFPELNTTIYKILDLHLEPIYNCTFNTLIVLVCHKKTCHQQNWTDHEDPNIFDGIIRLPVHNPSPLPVKREILLALQWKSLLVPQLMQSHQTILLQAVVISVACPSPSTHESTQLAKGPIHIPAWEASNKRDYRQLR